MDQEKLSQSTDYALRDLGKTFHELMGVFVSMNLIVDEVQRYEAFSDDVKSLARQSGQRMNELIPRLQAFYTRYQ